MRQERVISFKKSDISLVIVLSKLSFYISRIKYDFFLMIINSELLNTIDAYLNI